MGKVDVEKEEIIVRARMIEDRLRYVLGPRERSTLSSLPDSITALPKVLHALIKELYENSALELSPLEKTALIEGLEHLDAFVSELERVLRRYDSQIGDLERILDEAPFFGSRKERLEFVEPFEEESEAIQATPKFLRRNVDDLSLPFTDVPIVDDEKESWDYLFDSEKDKELIDKVQKSFRRFNQYVEDHSAESASLASIRQKLKKKGFFDE